MKLFAQDILFSVFTGFVLPGILLNYGVLFSRQEPVAVPEDTEPVLISRPVRVRTEKGLVREGDMDAYLVGVVLGEMPASFEMEALKAQSVVARTYAAKAYETGGKHGDCSVCTDPSCCQAHRTEEQFLEEGGSPEALEKIRQAVHETSGQVLTYDGELIEATYFSCSGGMTEDAVAVWGTEFPYLQSVESPGEEGAAYYRDTVSLTPEALCSRLEISLPEDPGDWITEVIHTRGGSVASITIGGSAFSGTELRSLLGLKSTAFDVSVEEASITFTTRGYGHRVGMSQYGADAMAAAGSTYPQILAHYYQGTALEVWQEPA